MSKLFKLKKWLTLPEAARHLSTAFSEEVSEADVLRLALDGHLTLSVHFVNHALARCGVVVPVEKAKLRKVTPLALGSIEVPEEHKGKPVMMLRGISINDTEVLELDEDVVHLDGIYDLPMIGAEQLDVEHRFQQLTDGPAVTLTNLNGAFVRCEDGKLCQLQMSYDDNEFSGGSKAQLEVIERRIAVEKLPPDEAKRLREQHALWRKEFLAKRKSRKEKDNCHPAGGLPSESVLVVRTESLRALQDQLADAESSAGRPLGQRAETTYLNIIGGLLDLMLGKTPAGKPHSVYKDQAAIISALLVHQKGKAGISQRTLEEKFAASKRSLSAD